MIIKTDTNPFIPRIYVSDQPLAFAVIQHSDFIYCIGPVYLTDSTSYLFNLPADMQPDIDTSLVFHCGISSLIEEALLIQNLFMEKSISFKDTVAFNCLDTQTVQNIQSNYVDIVFQNQEYNSRHNPYDQEVREIASIRNGDIEQLEKSWQEDYAGKVGELAATPLRQAQNIGIILVTLASRAAMDAGILPESAYSLSDSYIQEIENVTNPEAAWHLGRQAEHQYTAMVHKSKKSREQKHTRLTPDSRIDSCKQYIFLHLHEKISTSDIAKELYLNPDYLSTLFRKKEGITIRDYILEEKIQLVKNMLIYSKYSYSTISSYLGFSSQSHLGKKFKSVTGMTLHQYREKYGVKSI
ncbi:MAG: AraC family transcriptional regulator [Hespellia sp.]|nr:AraC family transcriptional regulator [Hespellia sp.]